MSLRFPTLRRFETLRAFGVAAEHFPAYTNTRLRPHSLDVVLGTFVIGGAGRHIMGDEIHRDGPGSFGITHYGQEHDILAERPMEIINLYLDPQNHALPPLAPELAPALQSFLPIHPGFHHRCNRRVRLRFADPGPPAALLRQLADETRTAQAGRRQAMEASLQVFLTLCCREVLQSGLEMGGGTEEGGALSGFAGTSTRPRANRSGWTGWRPWRV